MKHVIITDRIQDKIDDYEIAREAWLFGDDENLDEKRKAWVTAASAVAFAVSISIEQSK